jgi:hypothetical protein
MSASDKKPLEGFKKVADKIVGDYVLGTIGQGGFLLAKHVPGVGKAANYVAENVQDGYREAEQADSRRALARDIVECTRTLGSPMTSEQIKAKALKRGVPESALAEVKRLVDAETKPKAAAFPKPTIAAVGA